MSNPPPAKRGRGRPAVARCAFLGCAKVVYARGLCEGHYQHVRRGQPLRELRGYTIPEGRSERLVVLTPMRVTQEERATLQRLAKAAGVSAYELQRRWFRAELRKHS